MTILLFVLSMLSADLKIEITPPVATYKVAVSLPSEIDTAKSITVWHIYPKVKYRNAGKSIEFESAGGKYEVTCTVGEIGKPQQDFEITVQVGDLPKPEPNPQPGPPPPPPDPATKIASLTIVEETATPIPNRAKWFSDEGLVNFFTASNHPRPRILDKDAKDRNGQPPAVLAKLLPRAKSFPWWSLQDANGNIVRDGPLSSETPATFLSILVNNWRDIPASELATKIEIDGVTRSLGMLPRKSAAGSRFKLFGSTRSVDGSQPTILPRSQWVEVDLSRYVNEIKDQNGVGACNAFATCAVFENCRSLVGLPFRRLWPGQLYGRINGGSDQGSLLEDALQAITEDGLIEQPDNVRSYDWRSSGGSDWRDKAKSYRALEVWECANFDAIASAIQQGYFVDFGVMVGSNFSPNSEGVIPPYASGSRGGHAMCAVGLIKTKYGGKEYWCLVVQNSWGKSWGKAGFCYLPETYFSDKQIGGHYAVRVVTEDAKTSASVIAPTSDTVERLKVRTEYWDAQNGTANYQTTNNAATVTVTPKRLVWKTYCSGGVCRKVLVQE